MSSEPSMQKLVESEKNMNALLVNLDMLEKIQGILNTSYENMQEENDAGIISRILDEIYICFEFSEILTGKASVPYIPQTCEFFEKASKCGATHESVVEHLGYLKEEVEQDLSDIKRKIDIEVLSLRLLAEARYYERIEQYIENLFKIFINNENDEESKKVLSDLANEAREVFQKLEKNYIEVADSAEEIYDFHCNHENEEH